MNAFADLEADRLVNTGRFKTVVSGGSALAALFIGTVAIMTIDSAYAISKTTGTSTQQNSCGNDDLQLNIICQNVDSKDHGRDNTVIVNSTQPQ